MVNLCNKSINLRRLARAGLAGLLLSAGRAQEAAPTALPDYHVSSPSVANQEPVGAGPAPVSVLRFEPRVDVQARGPAELQADVAIRGGIFESTGFKVGAVPLFDPQTGHYFAEIPVAPAMLTAPAVLTGADNAGEGFNATAGTVSYGWRRIETRGEATVATGDHRWDRTSFYQGAVQPDAHDGGEWAADAEWTRSESAGTVPAGDHHFDRVAARLQRRDAASQTDLFAGYQRKFFGWPNLYTPFGVDETEDLQTQLIVLNHRWRTAGGEWEAGAYYRRNRDDYEFNRHVPGQFNPYQHTTWVRGLAFGGWQEAGDWTLHLSGGLLRDGLQSTALLAGPRAGRTLAKAAVVPERAWRVDGGEWRVRAGVTVDAGGRHTAAWSPIVHVEWQPPAGGTWYAEYAGATEVPTYTALKSSPASGLFRGNPTLGRETSRNLEAGYRWRQAGWSASVAGFRRWDDDLVDWTYKQGVLARTANPVDLATDGFEAQLSRRTTHWEVVLGYAWLHKRADYGSATVDASFYALNFPIDRLTGAVIWRPLPGWEVRVDNEYRRQEPNALRTSGGDTAFLTSAGVYFLPPAWRGWEFSVQADNLWDSRFQEVPAVPAAGRQVAAAVTRRW